MPRARTHHLRSLAAVLLVVAGVPTGAAFAGVAVPFDVRQTGAVGDGSALNTAAIQATIDRCAAAGGGTVVVPKGDFLTGPLFLKPRVNLELSEGARLTGSKDIADYPVVKNQRYEGHLRDMVAPLLTVDRCDHFRLTGPGTIDGNGAAFWKLASPAGRPRLCVISHSSDVAVHGVRFFSSATWNLLLYDCDTCAVGDCRFEIPDGASGPSTDGTDIDSCSHVSVEDCNYSVNDDCICLKGNRYDGLDQEPKSPPVTDVRISGCTFARGMGALSLGTEATVIHHVEMGNCTVKGKMPMLRVKFRPDTPGQSYDDVRVHDIKLDGKGTILSVEPVHGTKVPTKASPVSRLSNVDVENITGSTLRRRPRPSTASRSATST
jgi:polygalacturonase